MYDLQVTEIRDILDVTGVAPAFNVTPKSVIIEGRDFRSVQYVLINDMKSPSILQESSSRMIAQVPAALGSAPIRTVVAVSNRLTNTFQSQITFALRDTPSVISGMERLIQTFVKMLLTTPGSDIFSPKSGGGVLRAVARQTTRDGGSMVSDLQAGIDRVQRQLIAIQANDRTLALSERLLSVTLLEAKFILSELALVGRLLIRNQTNQRSLVGLGL